MINWVFDGKINFLGLPGSAQKIFVKDPYIIFFIDEWKVDNDIMKAKYLIYNNKTHKDNEFNTIDELNTELVKLNINDCRLESINKIFKEFMNTGLCYWFPDNVKKALVETKRKITDDATDAEKYRNALFNFRVNNPLSKEDKKFLFLFGEKDITLTRAINLHLAQVIEEKEKSYFIGKALSDLNNTADESISLSLLTLIKKCDEKKVEKAKSIFLKKFKTDGIEKRIEDAVNYSRG